LPVLLPSKLDSTALASGPSSVVFCAPVIGVIDHRVAAKPRWNLSEEQSLEVVQRGFEFKQ
jgi:hypothetical protein